ncbi:MAG: hypothetical protein HAW59_03685 [Betaproteobacteria bacterium]|nr:hypothetical protein [Betaproteobacteria bacterium]
MIDWFIENFRVISLVSAVIPMTAFFILRRGKTDKQLGAFSGLIFSGASIPTGILLGLMAVKPGIAPQITDIPFMFGPVGVFVAFWALGRIRDIFEKNAPVGGK